MRYFILCVAIVMSLSYNVIAQVPPAPMSSTGSAKISGASWTKTNNVDFVLRNGKGNTVTNVKDLVYLKTDTLAVLDKTGRVIYLLEDFKDAPIGTVGKASVLTSNIGKDFYLTNPYSFITYVNDESYAGEFSNIQGNYIDYLDGVGATYYLDGVRSFKNWGAKNITKMATAPDNTYWYRDADKDQYGVLKKGKPIDYTNATTEKDGNNLIVKINNVKTYILEGYYTIASFVYKPVKLYAGSTATTTTVASGTVGCVEGDCINGWGKWQYEDAYYDGFWRNAKRNGYGLYKWEGVGKYIGNWENGSMSGYGAYLADNDDNIIGEYSNGKLNGMGFTVFGDEWSQGIYVNGELKTPYTFYTNNVEVGCTAGDCENKYGKMVWSNGDYFVGFFKNGKLYMGTYTFANGDKYSGMFNKENQFNGIGRYFYEDGGYYGGEWTNGKFNGRGYYHNKDLVQQIGEWSSGTLHKKFK
ncbi:hypothetical protein ATE92_0543 [Ulvibacter sp. MAR_2010_11]|uniref:hypothetical protein n=1 Tax=Ulvibacter sp. MAR_2010_11 TaxID=1250229 RepID=UPI000CBD28E1|nr:hypothetical protein [Ulvibacter sp. MAR_2010_11]PKA82414.1 hypothetical protein ATE92_0543 [Ulvibacter sp. MAR_2010_11]